MDILLTLLLVVQNVRQHLNRHRFFHLNFFAQAAENPQLIVDFLSIYREPEIDIEEEQLQLVYYGHLSYEDTLLMTFFTRRFWIKRIEEILESEKNRSSV